jgi:hypothetical protein
MSDNIELQRLFILIIFSVIFIVAFIEFKCNDIKKDIEDYIEQLLKEDDYV